MLHRDEDLEQLKLSFPIKKEIDLDALNFLASNDGEILCKCSYYAEKQQHNICYQIDKTSFVNIKTVKLGEEELPRLMRDSLKVIEIISKNNLNLGNVLVSKSDLYRNKDGFIFFYLPIEKKKNVLFKDFVIQILKKCGCKSNISKNLQKELKTCVGITEIEASINRYFPMKQLEEFSKQEEEVGTTLLNEKEEEMGTTLLNKPEEEVGTTILSEQGEETGTTLLNKPEEEAGTTLLNEQEEETGTTLLKEQESGTTLLQQQVEPELCTTAYFTNQFGECETTVLSDMAMPGREEKVSFEEEHYNLYLLRNSTGEKVHVNKPVFQIGKDFRQMDYVLGSESVSRKHATIYLEPDAAFILDEHSTNGTTVEGVRLIPDEKMELEDGYIVSLGQEVFQVMIERK